MKFGPLLMIAAACLLPLDAIAATPKLSGTYALSLSQNCQVTVGTSTYDNIELGNGTTTTLANLFDQTIDDGKFSQSVGIANFNDSSHTLSFSGTQVNGSVLIVPGLSSDSELMTSSPNSVSVGYSVPSSSSFVLSGVTYQAAYGNIVKGIAKYATFVALDPSKPACSDYGTAVHQ
jgi:hypothetical protein